MSQARPPVTAAVRALRELGVVYQEHLYPYQDRGGAAASAQHLGAPLHAVIKTLILEDEDAQALVMLMHGDLEVAVGVLAKALGKKRLGPCSPEVAQRWSGYLVGGISPFGLRHPMPIYAQDTIFGLDRLWINGGKRGFLVSMEPAELERALAPTWVEAAAPRA